MICGKFLPAVLPLGGLFRLEPPVVEAGASTSGAAPPDGELPAGLRGPPGEGLVAEVRVPLEAGVLRLRLFAAEGSALAGLADGEGTT